MKAAVAHELGGPLMIENVPQPEPGRDEVVVQIEASGLCHTDLHAVHGGLASQAEPLADPWA